MAVTKTDSELTSAIVGLLARNDKLVFSPKAVVKFPAAASRKAGSPGEGQPEGHYLVIQFPQAYQNNPAAEKGRVDHGRALRIQLCNKGVRRRSRANGRAVTETAPRMGPR